MADGGKRAPVGSTQENVCGTGERGSKDAKRALKATKEHGTDPRKVGGQDPTRNDEATEHWRGHTTPKKQKLPSRDMAPRIAEAGLAEPKSPDATQTDPGTEAPAAGKLGGRAALVTPTSEQGGGLPDDRNTKGATAHLTGWY